MQRLRACLKIGNVPSGVEFWAAILLCVCIAKAAGIAGGSVRQAQMGRALVRVTARAPGPMWQATERERGSMWMG